MDVNGEEYVKNMQPKNLSNTIKITSYPLDLGKFDRDLNFWAGPTVSITVNNSTSVIVDLFSTSAFSNFYLSLRWFQQKFI